MQRWNEMENGYYKCSRCSYFTSDRKISICPGCKATMKNTELNNGTAYASERWNRTDSGHYKCSKCEYFQSDRKLGTCPGCKSAMESTELINGTAYMSSKIGMLPIDSDGLRKAVDEIERLYADNREILSHLENLYNVLDGNSLKIDALLKKYKPHYKLGNK